MPTLPFVSLCMIVKNEEEFLPGCLESIRPFVDEMIVVDTGSNDRTVEIARSLGARVHHFSWIDDFSAARNESLRHAEGSWIVYVDADERLVCPERGDCLRQAAAVEQVDAYSVPIQSRRNNAEGAYVQVAYNIRLFRKFPGIRFEGEVHERVEPFLDRIPARCQVAPFSIEHLGYDINAEEEQKKLQRNLALARKHVSRDPHNAYALYYLGLTLLALKQLREGRNSLLRALAGRGLTLPLRAMTLNLLSYLHIEESDYPGAAQKAQESLDVVARQNTGRVFLGFSLYKQGDYARALPLLLQALEFLTLPPHLRETHLSQEHTADVLDLTKMIASCYTQIQEYPSAIPLLRQYLEKRPSEPEVLRLLGICHLNCGTFDAAVEALRAADALGIDRSLTALPLSYGLFQCGRYREFRECFLAFAEKTTADIETAAKLMLSMSRCDEGLRLLAQTFHAKPHVLRAAPLHLLNRLAADLSSSMGNGGSLSEFLSGIMPRGKEGEALLGVVVDAFLRHRRFAELTAILDELHRRHPDIPVILEALGTTQIKAGDLHAAIAAYSKLHERQPLRADLERLLAGLHAKVGDFGRAARYLRSQG